jgi:hypothetical protein
LSNSLQDRFPELFFDTKTVEEKTPKKVQPSFGQIVAKILVGHGIQDSGVASDIAQAATDYFATPVVKT